MYEDLRQVCWWNGMKNDITNFVACCDICNKVKAEHQKPAGLLQPLPASQWKWDDICMDFITGLPKSHRGNDAIWVIVDTLTKVAHFLPIRTTYRANQLAQLYVSRIVSLHGVPKTITSCRGSLFTSHYKDSGLLQQNLLLQLRFVAIKHIITTNSPVVVIGRTYCHNLVWSR